MAWDHVFLKNKFILYGYGISNQKVAEFFKQNNVIFIVVEDDYLLDENYVIIKSPGISNNTFFMKKCLSLNLLIISDIELFYMLRPNLKYIGITGTYGKTSTCTLLYNIMRNLYNVKLCGNIGIPIFNYIEEDVDFLIIELSSYQLEWTFSFRANYFIILNIFDHHLNHHITYENYLEAKLKPLKNLKVDDLLIINHSLNKYLINQEINCRVFSFFKFEISNTVYDLDNITYFDYDYNKENFEAIYRVLKELNISDQVILKELFEFKNLPYRMEKIIDNNHLVIINDSKSTGFIALKEGINYCKKYYANYFLTIIIGGKLDLEEFRKNISLIKELNALDVYCYGENKVLFNKIIKCLCFETLDEVVANIVIKTNQIILFSPAAQSLDQFKSFEERGKCFNNYIFKKLKL